MTNTDPQGWFLTSQALDHRETIAALAAALPDVIYDGFRSTELDSEIKKDVADDMAIDLARAGFALVRITPGQHERTQDLSPFLSRKED
jgi:hypothetical protein